MGAADRFSDDPKVEFAAVDCTTFQALCSTNDVSGYPTFKYFNYYKNTKPYNGGRTVSNNFCSFYLFIVCQLLSYNSDWTRASLHT